MFICQLGGHTTKPGEPQVKVVTEVRKVTYTNRVRKFDDFGNYAGTDEVASVGTEIVREIEACKECLDKMTIPEGWRVQ
jgi:hypothetical protein